jgi:hypothetical protein
MSKLYATQQAPHPILVDVLQVAPNRVMFTYDRRADLSSATDVTNYWIRGNMGAVGIASVNMGDALTAQNSLRPDMAEITAADNSSMRFVITLPDNATTGVMYIVLPCFVNLEGMSGYRGEN